MLRRYAVRVVPVSAKEGIGLDVLRRNILESLPGRSVDTIDIPYGESYLIREIGRHCRIIRLHDTGRGIRLLVEGRGEVIDRYKGRLEKAAYKPRGR